MKKFIIIFAISFFLFPNISFSNGNFQSDTISTSEGNLTITFFGHASLMFQFQGKIIYLDPVMAEADYSKLPDADLILVTHEHYDHLDLDAIKEIKKKNTILVLTPACKKKYKGKAIVMKNSDVKTVLGLKIEAVPAYNIKHKRRDGKPFHPKGRGNGYVVTFGDKRVYIAGDTENTPEMKKLKNIDIAFLPMNLPYTMTPEMVADAARSFRPKILYPYHMGDTDPQKLVKLLKNEKDIEIRIRELK